MMIDVDANKVLDIARSYLNYSEKDSANDLTGDSVGHNNYTVFAKILDDLGDFYNGKKQGYAWCDVFVDCVVFLACNKDEEAALYVLCQPKYSAGAGCAYSAQYYKQAGRWSTTPQIGAQIFFSYRPGDVSHTGLVESFTSTTVTTIEGNSNDRVVRRTYNINNGNIYGYGLPRYGEVNSTTPAQPTTPTPVTPTVPTASGCNIKLPELQKGSIGASVVALQGILIANRISCGPDGADGEFGDNTANAVRIFQQRNGLGVDGIVGPVTWAKLLGGTKV